MNVLGLDIGGANVKAATADGDTLTLPFAVWKKSQLLTETLRNMVARQLQVSPHLVAMTMTAELADCFLTKAEGVSFVIRAVERAFDGVPLRIWLTSGEFAEPADACELPTLVAAANWHALATWAARAVPRGPALLIDVGSTTADIIPLLDGQPIPYGLNDVDRLLSGELVYTGVRRTPCMAVAAVVPLRDQECPLAAELFATMADVHVINGRIREDSDDCDTADGRPLVREFALNRLAHMVCCDRTEIEDSELAAIAQFLAERQVLQVRHAVERVLRRFPQPRGHGDRVNVLLCGSGAFLAEAATAAFPPETFHEPLILADMFHKCVSSAACAFAVARLANDRCGDDLLQTTSLPVPR
ncbi:MAG: hydantoinase/oxoprolinase family protein [Planctomycetaceae bacterium]